MCVALPSLRIKLFHAFIPYFLHVRLFNFTLNKMMQSTIISDWVLSLMHHDHQNHRNGVQVYYSKNIFEILSTIVNLDFN